MAETVRILRKTNFLKTSQNFEKGNKILSKWSEFGVRTQIYFSYVPAALIMFHTCVFVREVSISHRWKDLLQQLQEHRGLLANIVENLSVLRDIELVSQEVKELHVSLHRGSASTCGH